MRVLVTGPRTWGVVPKDAPDVCAASTRARDEVDALLNALDATPVTVLINGGCQGADTWAARWGKSKGLKVITVNAPFDSLGPVAGPMRNSYMIEHPELVLACGEGAGTENTVKQALLKGIPVRRVKR